MARRKTSAAVAVAMLVTVIVGSPAAADSNIELANGSGNSVAGESGVVRTFALQVRQANDGTVTGEVQVHRLDNGFLAHYAVDCLRIDHSGPLGLPAATMSGVTTFGGFGVGIPFWVKVADGGNGPNWEFPNNLDAISLVRNFWQPEEPVYDCTSDEPLSFPGMMWPLVLSEGNITIH